MTEVLLFSVFITILTLTSAYFEPLTPLKVIIRKIFPSFVIILFFLVLCFKIIEYYHSQILYQKKLMEDLNNSLFKLSSELKIEKMLYNCLEILIDFYKGDIGMLIILNDRLKNFVSTDIITINLSPIVEVNKVENYIYTSLSPDKITFREEQKIKELIKKYDFNKCSGIITLPVYSEQETKAIAIVGISRKSKREFIKDLDSSRSVIEVFLKHLNLELENAILHEDINIASITDPLTDVYNRRYFNIRLKEEFAKAKREGYPFSIMISDLDNFKKYVDKYGHPMGDIILKEVALLLKNSLRETDIICRFGGDEFAYLLPFSLGEEAKIVAERIKKNVQNYKFLSDKLNEDVHITLSIGIACFPEHAKSEEEILSKADNALFIAKNSGKNTIVVYGEKGG
ncbi:MAG: GGDEF domain-containing protein [Candidatus Omnitrophica bacterium]|nr:GGDEF domain-containing protein [Candidatus Omnitrophota bacterium]